MASEGISDVPAVALAHIGTTLGSQWNSKPFLAALAMLARIVTVICNSSRISGFTPKEFSPEC